MEKNTLLCYIFSENAKKNTKRLTRQTFVFIDQPFELD